MSTTSAIDPKMTVVAAPDVTRGLDNLLERDLLPDWSSRIGIRRLLKSV